MRACWQYRQFDQSVPSGDEDNTRIGNFCTAHEAHGPGLGSIGERLLSAENEHTGVLATCVIRTCRAKYTFPVILTSG